MKMGFQLTEIKIAQRNALSFNQFAEREALRNLPYNLLIIKHLHKYELCSYGLCMAVPDYWDRTTAVLSSAPVWHEVVFGCARLTTNSIWSNCSFSRGVAA